MSRDRLFLFRICACAFIVVGWLMMSALHHYLIGPAVGGFGIGLLFSTAHDWG